MLLDIFYTTPNTSNESSGKCDIITFVCPRKTLYVLWVVGIVSKTFKEGQKCACVKRKIRVSFLMLTGVLKHLSFYFSGFSMIVFSKKLYKDLLNFISSSFVVFNGDFRVSCDSDQSSHSPEGYFSLGSKINRESMKRPISKVI